MTLGVNLLDVSSIDGVSSRCCLLHSVVNSEKGEIKIKKLGKIKVAIEFKELKISTP